jgi:hypothetical protein
MQPMTDISEHRRDIIRNVRIPALQSIQRAGNASNVDIRQLVQVPRAADDNSYEVTQPAMVGFVEDFCEMTEGDCVFFWDSVVQDCMEVEG